MANKFIDKGYLLQSLRSFKSVILDAAFAGKATTESTFFNHNARITALEQADPPGGTTVIANPEGEATDELNSIQIGEDIYEIVGGSGGEYSETVLYTASASATTYTLSESYKNFDAIEVIGTYADTYSGRQLYFTNIYPVSELQVHEGTTDSFGLCNDSQYTYFAVTDETTFTKTIEQTIYVCKIKGLKFGGSEGGSSNNYSTTEQVIGTWINNKPLYRKTFEVNFHTDGYAWVDTGCIIDNIDTIVNYSITANDTYVGGAPANCSICSFRYNNSNIQMYVNSSWYLDVHTITIEYTKTTD